jgi:2-oxoglutarate dehydrogenase E2 component (dihydrolipoamide succinyltransferase)
MTYELKIPELGESIHEVQISHWLKPEGSWVEKDENVVEIESEKATVDLPAPAAGKITTVTKHDGQTAEVGEVVGYIEEGARPAQAPAEKAKMEMIVEPAAAVENTAPAERPHRGTSGNGRRRPKAETAKPQAAPPPIPLEEKREEKEKKTAAAPPAAQRHEEEVPMTLVRRRLAQRLLDVQRNTAMLTTVNEADLSAVVAARGKYRDEFREEFQVKLGFMSFFVKAVVEALELYPVLNAEVRDEAIVYRNYYDIGIAVAGGKGLVVPVLRDAQRMSFAGIERAIDDFAARAQANRLKPDELTGGTFTITNGGVFGSLLSTPILNGSQAGILGLHAIEDRPVARQGQVAIRPMMYIALTYDHRIVDGREAVGFLRRIKELIEEPVRMLLEV